MNTETIKPEIDREDSHALISVEKINALEVFNGGMLPIIEEIHKKVALLVPDVTTAKGRKEIASMANRIARSKTLLDDVGKNLVADWKAKSKIVDENRKWMRDKLDELKEVTRAPLTAWEKAEAERVAKYENRLKDLIVFQNIPYGVNVQHIQEIIQEIEAIEVGDDWGEAKERATAEKSYAIKNANQRLAERMQYDEQQLEIQRLRQQEQARQAKELEEKKNAELAERARTEAEMKAKRAIEEAEAKAKAAVEAQKRAEDRAKQVEENAKREAELAIQREKAREETAKREAEYKAKKEAERIAADKATAEIEANKKEEAIKNRIKYIDAATSAITTIIIEDEESAAENIVLAILAGEVPYISFHVS